MASKTPSCSGPCPPPRITSPNTGKLSSDGTRQPVSCSPAIVSAPWQNAWHVTDVLRFSREVEPIIYIYREREKERDYKRLAHVTIEAGKFKICRPDIPVWVRRPEAAAEPGRANVSVRRPRQAGEFSLGRERSVYSGFPVLGWGPPTWGRAIYLIQSPDLDVNLIQKHLHRHTQNNVWPNIWAPHDPVKLTHKLNHHIWLSIT